MNNFLNQLNLTPQERRVVAIIFLVVIIVLNFLFVWPHFGEWSSINKQLANMRGQIDNENRTILMDRNPTNGWRKGVDQLARKERKEGGGVVERVIDPQVQLQNTIRVQERKTGVLVENYTPGAVKTNDAFFEEHSTTINVDSQEPQLVSFLYNMGNDSAMIRVAKLDLKPDNGSTRYRLKGALTLTANYAKRPPAAAEAAAVKTAPRVKAAGSPAATPAAALKPKPAGPPAPGQTAKHPPAGPSAPRGRPQQPGGPISPFNRPRRMPVPVPGQQ